MKLYHIDDELLVELVQEAKEALQETFPRAVGIPPAGVFQGLLLLMQERRIVLPIATSELAYLMGRMYQVLVERSRGDTTSDDYNACVRSGIDPMSLREPREDSDRL